jgi:regulator of sirC expression with transglutaminase-like and TPR domain
MSAGDDFSALVTGPEADLRLDRAWALITVHAHPDGDVDALLEGLDQLAGGVAVPTLDGLLDHLFTDLRFTGNVDEYGDPRNSYLDEVLARRLGIPITLSVLTMEVGRRVGVPVAGVGMPGHFLLRDRVNPSVFVDPFSGGRVIDADECAARFHRLHGEDAPFSAAWLEPTGPRAIVARMLANLVRAFRDGRDQRGLLWALDLRTRLPDASDEDRRALLGLRASQN